MFRKKNSAGTKLRQNALATESLIADLRAIPGPWFNDALVIPTTEVVDFFYW